MKCKLLFSWAALGFVCSALAQTAGTYENPGLVLSPPDIPPQVDAVNFVNAGQFVINFTNDLITLPLFPPAPGPILPYETANTLNYSNLFGSLMSCNLGFRLESFDTASGLRHPASSFFNAGTIECGTLNTTNYLVSSGGSQFFGTTQVVLLTIAGSKFNASATNIVNSGAINMGFESVLSLKGGSVDLSQSTLAMETTGFSLNQGNDNFFANGGIFDGYWGASTNVVSQGGFFQANPPRTPGHLVTDRQYRVFAQQLVINGLSYVLDEFDATGTNRYVRAAFIGNTNLNVQANVYFPPDPLDFFFGDIAVEYTNTLGTSANNIYVLDAYGVFTNQVLLLNGFAGSRSTFIPFNYAVFQSPAIFSPFLLQPESATVVPPGTFNGDVETNQYSAYQALFLPTSINLGDVFGQNITNAPGRIQVIADDYLNLADSHIVSLNYLQLKSTNEFAGNVGSRISAPFVDLNLRSTNGFLAVSNLLAPTIARPEGTIDLYSARWTNTTFAINPVTGVLGSQTNHYHVLFADAHFSPTTPSRAQDLILHSTNLVGGVDNIVINDVLTITRSMLFDSSRITIATNGPDAANPSGAIVFTDQSIIWPSATPRLQYFTNNGYFQSVNAVFFGGSRSSPYFTSTFDEPYQVFVNTGGVTNFSSRIWANYFEDSGNFLATGGSLRLERSLNAIMTNGAFLAPFADLSINAGSLLISNEVVLAGGAISLAVTNVLDDGSLQTGVADLVTNKNVWQARGFNLLAVPRQGSLLATIISNTAATFQRTSSRSAAADLGCVPEGFFNNGAIGRFILHGDTNSLFQFTGVGGANAFYIDSLEFEDFTATNRDAVGNFLGVQIDANMKIYYGQALANGSSIAEKLNGANGGRFCWVSNWNCGFFSSTNLLYPDGTTNRVNTALAQSCDIDSNTNGIVNCNDPAPIPGGGCNLGALGSFSTNGPPPSGDGGPTGGHTNSANGLPILNFPSASGSAMAGTFLPAKVTYSGLFYDTNGVTTSSSGFFTAKATDSRGAFSGSVVMGNGKHGFSGRFDASGQFSARIAKTSLTLTLQLDPQSADQLRGTVTDGHWSADLLADRQVSATAKAGNYTLIIPGDAQDTSSPGGHGFGTATVDSAGGIKWSGTLADGTKVTQSSALSQQGIWPLYAPLYGGGGALVSWIQFTNQPESDLNGAMIWMKPASGGSKYYPHGFTNEVDAIGSAYRAPLGGTRVIKMTLGNLMLVGGGLHSSLTNSLTLGLNNRVTVPAGSKLTLTITTSSGLFKGSAMNPETGKTVPFQGMLFEKANIGIGYFLGPDQSGEVYLGPAP